MMSRRGLAPILIVFVIAAILIFGGGALYYAKKSFMPKPVTCTEEAKQCPDGSYVSRTGPNCEFAECPTATSTVQSTSTQNITAKWQTYQDEKHGFLFKYPGSERPPLASPNFNGLDVSLSTYLPGPTGLLIHFEPDASMFSELFRFHVVQKTNHPWQQSANVLSGYENKKIKVGDLDAYQDVKIALGPEGDSVEAWARTSISNKDSNKFVFIDAIRQRIFPKQPVSSFPEEIAINTASDFIKEYNLILSTFKFIEPNAGITGTLFGKVSIGPICPVERIGIPCPVPPAAYASREFLVLSSDQSKTITSFHANASGTYNVSLPPGNYVVVSAKTGIGFLSKDLPSIVTIKSGETTTLNIGVDTGIR